MTRLTSKNVVIRMTACDYRGRNLVVTLYPHALSIRRAGMRTDGYSIGYDAVYEAAGRMYAMALLAEGRSRSGKALTAIGRTKSKAKSKPKPKAKAKPKAIRRYHGRGVEL